MHLARIHLLLLLLLGPLGCRAGLGDGCEDHEDCRSVERGYCAITGICVANCVVEGEACGDGLCASVGRLVCLPRCEDHGGCRESDACNEVPGGRACVLEDVLAEPL